MSLSKDMFCEELLVHHVDIMKYMTRVHVHTVCVQFQKSNIISKITLAFNNCY